MAPRKTHIQFINEVKDLPITIIGTYTTSKTKLDVQCTICLNKWQTRPNDILNGQGCPTCFEGRRGKSRLSNTEQFSKKLNCSTIVIKGMYVKKDIPILCNCTICNTDWSPTPSRLLEGTRCPSCAAYGFNLNKEAELYFYLIDNKYIGFGITGDASNRHKAHKRNLIRAGYSFRIIHRFKFGSGEAALRVENLIKKKYECIGINVEGFKTEAYLK